MTSRVRTDLPARTAPAGGNLTPSDWLAWVRAQVLNAVGQSAEQRQLACAADREPIRLVYGEERLGAQILNVVPFGQNVLVQCLWCLAGDSVQEVQFNDEPLPGTFSVTNYTGAQVAVDGPLATAFSAHGLSYTDTLTGYLYSVVTMPQSAFTGSLQFTARVRGRRLYDPRKDSTAGGSGAHRLNNSATWEYSTNPALADADYLYSSAYGCGKAVDWSTVITAANANDATVGGEPRRRLDGVTIPGMSPVKNVAETLRTYAGCFHLPGPNGIQLVPDRPASSVASYSHAAGQIAGLSRLEKRDSGGLPSAVEVVYTDRSADPWRDATALAQLPGAGVTVPYRLQQVRLPGIQRHSQANREAIERLNKLNVNDLSLVLDVFDVGIAHEIGDVITIADHPVGLSNKLMRIADAPQVVGRGVWRLPCVEYDPAVYSDVVVTGPTYPDTGFASPAMPPPDVASLSVAVLADGTRRYTVIVPTGAARGTRIQVRSVVGASGSWGAMSDFFSLDYDPAVSTYTRESNLPAGSGTWSFSAKLVTVFGVESANAAVINGAVLGSDPVGYSNIANLLLNSDWTEDLGHTVGAYFADTRSLRHWLPGGSTATPGYGRNYDGGKVWNVGLGGAWMHNSTTVVGQYQYFYQWVPVVAGVEYELQVRCSTHRQYAYAAINWYNAAKDTLLGSIADGFDAGGAVDGDPYQVATHRKFWCKGVAPAGTAFALVHFLMQNTAATGTAGYTFWSQAMLNVAPPGVTRDTATPWMPSGPSTVDGQLMATVRREFGGAALGAVYNTWTTLDSYSFTAPVLGQVDLSCIYSFRNVFVGTVTGGGTPWFHVRLRIVHAGGTVDGTVHNPWNGDAINQAYVHVGAHVESVPVLAGTVTVYLEIFQLFTNDIGGFPANFSQMFFEKINHVASFNRKD